MAKKMVAIIEAEEALVAEDQRKRKDMAHKQRKERRLLRQGRNPALAWKAPISKKQTRRKKTYKENTLPKC